MSEAIRSPSSGRHILGSIDQSEWDSTDTRRWVSRISPVSPSLLRSETPRYAERQITLKYAVSAMPGSVRQHPLLTRNEQGRTVLHHSYITECVGSVGCASLREPLSRPMCDQRNPKASPILRPVVNDTTNSPSTFSPRASSRKSRASRGLSDCISSCLTFGGSTSAAGLRGIQSPLAASSRSYGIYGGPDEDVPFGRYQHLLHPVEYATKEKMSSQ